MFGACPNIAISFIMLEGSGASECASRRRMTAKIVLTVPTVLTVLVAWIALMYWLGPYSGDHCDEC